MSNQYFKQNAKFIFFKKRKEIAEQSSIKRFIHYLILSCSLI